MNSITKKNIVTHPSIEQAMEFLGIMAAEKQDCPKSRMDVVRNEIIRSNTWTLTEKELQYASKLAWRNNTRCIGRRYWEGLEIRDMRHLTHEEDVAQAALDHVEDAFNKGKLKPICTIYQPQSPNEPGLRLWNHQIIRYAGYREPDGSIIGDPHSIPMTQKLKDYFGWEGPKTHFDLLPIVVQFPNRKPKLFEFPKEYAHEVEITHPELDWFAELNLKWYSVPALSDMVMEAGGIHYTAAPFSGWYMSTEIASRNFGDTTRYNLLPIVAKRMGIDTRSLRTLWKDRALIELNVAVLHSFEKAGVTLNDHHTASQDFIKFQNKESKSGRETYADWAWIVPPMSGSSCPAFHEEYENKILSPNFFYQESPF